MRIFVPRLSDKAFHKKQVVPYIHLLLVRLSVLDLDVLNDNKKHSFIVRIRLEMVKRGIINTVSCSCL